MGILEYIHVTLYIGNGVGGRMLGVLWVLGVVVWVVVRIRSVILMWRRSTLPLHSRSALLGIFSQFFPFFLVTPPLSVQLIFRSCQSFNHSIVKNICKWSSKDHIVLVCGGKKRIASFCNLPLVENFPLLIVSQLEIVFPKPWMQTCRYLS